MRMLPCEAAEFTVHMTIHLTMFQVVLVYVLVAEPQWFGPISDGYVL